MHVDNTELGFINILSSDAYLGSVYKQNPYVFILPFHADHSQKFLMFWMYIDEKDITKDKIWKMLERTIRVGKLHGLFAGMHGAEMVPCFIRNHETRPIRILRLSFFSAFIDSLLLMDEAALVPGEVIPEGVRCTWYLSPIL